MYIKNNFSNSLFTTGHRTITLGTVIFGTVLFFLGILIFAYPTLIAYFFGAVILFVGLSALFASWKLWQLRNEIANLNKPDNEPFHHSSPEMKRYDITYIRW